MGKYVKKPVEIEAFRWTEVRDTADPKWAIDALVSGSIYFEYESGSSRPKYLVIKTLEGDMKASIGDWIIKGVRGELYPCKHEIFMETYEPAPLTWNFPEKGE